jgi:cellulose synthase/poly-beta-1,6-N-acetylglucosamine synthase-like glycosyltransferase
MRDAADALLILLASLLLVPSAFLFVQVVVGSFSRQDPRPPFPPSSASVAVLMPAHDEEVGIAASIRSVLEQLRPGDRLLVVADNCSDGTAALARSLGAEVVERSDPTLRGKGYALDFGVRALEKMPADVVVVVDADCTLAPGALAALAGACVATDRPVQALYLMHPPTGASLGIRLAAFAWIIRNKLRPRGASRLGWPCQLMGTGMAFRWAAIEQAALASGHLVEDMQLGLELALAGTPPLFCERALVESVFPSDSEGIASQRMRWEHGHLATIGRDAPRLLWRAVRRLDLPLFTMALDLAVPPLASLVLMLFICAVMAAAWWAAAGAVVPLALAGVALALVASAVLLAWWREGRRLVSPRELAYLPVYVAAKIPVYVRLFTRRQAQWVRTKRDGQQS